MSTDWTPDGINCRQCGRHDYLLYVHEETVDEWSRCSAHADCPLATKPVRKLELWAPPLKWTSERPTVPGWYWTLGRSGIPAVVYVERGHRDQLLEVSGRYVADLNRHWAGPLPMPEAP